MPSVLARFTARSAEHASAPFANPALMSVVIAPLASFTPASDKCARGPVPSQPRLRPTVPLLPPPRAKLQFMVEPAAVTADGNAPRLFRKETADVTTATRFAGANRLRKS